MQTFIIKSASGQATVEFFEREPEDTDKSIDHFWVRIQDRDLSAVGRVYAGYAGYASHPAGSHPVNLFAEMARRWSGWEGELNWDSIEGELRIRCTRDRFGHISIRVELRSGHWENNWLVRATVIAEAGQLERIAREAALFFGQPSL